MQNKKGQAPKKRKETRLTVVAETGIICEFWNVEIRESIQDEGRTLKLFLNSKKK
jgi:hypothetical protein